MSEARHIDDDGAPDPQVEALLDALAQPRQGPAPAWLESLDQWLLVAVVAAPDLRSGDVAGLTAGAAATEPAGAGRVAVAWALPGPPEGGGAGARDQLGALRTWVAAGAGRRAVAAAAPGACTPTAILGEAPDEAAALFRATAGRGEGLWVADGLRAALPGPAIADAGGWRLRTAGRARPRAAWMVGGLAAVAAALLFFTLRPDVARAPPAGDIYLTGERATRGSDASALPGDDVLHADRVRVVVDAEAGTFLSLVVLDSEGAFGLPDPTLVNRPVEGEGRVQGVFVVEGPAGRERFVALLTRRPVDDLAALLARSGAKGADRDAKVAALRAALRGHAGADGFTLLEAVEVKHGP